MRRFTPLRGIAVVLAVMAAVVVADYALEGGFQRSPYRRVAPGPDGTVRIDLSGFGPGELRFFRFLNPGNQEVKFFVGRDRSGEVQVAFDANEICAKRKRGFHQDGEWLVCNTCDRAFRLDEVNAGGGGCKPVPLAHSIRDGELILTEDQILRGWRLFR